MLCLPYRWYSSAVTPPRSALHPPRCRTQPYVPPCSSGHSSLRGSWLHVNWAKPGSRKGLGGRAYPGAPKNMTARILASLQTCEVCVSEVATKTTAISQPALPGLSSSPRLQRARCPPPATSRPFRIVFLAVKFFSGVKSHAPRYCWKQGNGLS
jgi:hypothetical protein